MTWRQCTAIAVGMAFVIGGIAAPLTHRASQDAVASALDQGRVAAIGLAEAADAWIGAQAEEAWIDIDARQSFRRAVDLMLSGAATYVQVVAGGAVVVDAADEAWSAKRRPLIAPGSAGASGDATLVRVNGGLLGDIIVPLAAGADSATGATSYVRLGTNLAPLDSQLWTIRLAGAGSSVAVFLLTCLMGIASLAWLGRRGIVTSPLRARTATAPDSVRAPAMEAEVVLCPLLLDEDAKQVMLNGTPIFLPPKPFELLALLVRENGRVLGDDEIVGPLWPNTELADSSDVRQCVYLLRKRLDAVINGAGACIANVKGFGYRYDVATLEGLIRESDQV